MQHLPCVCDIRWRCALFAITTIVAAVLCLCVAASTPSDTGEAELPWWDPAWSHRQIVEIITPDPTGSINTASVVIEAQGVAAADGRDLRLVDAAGQPVRFEIIKTEMGVFQLHFEVTNPATRRYACYYGNPAAQPIQQTWTKRLGGLRLKTMENTLRQNAMSWAHLQRLIEASQKTYGESDWPLIDDNVNPFAKREEEHDHYISIYEGQLYCPESGVYTFITNSDDASFLLIDGQMVVQWPGGHNPAPNWDPTYSATITLTQGIHKIAYYHVETLGGQLARAGWRRPGERRFSIIGEEFFLRELRTQVVACQARAKALNAFFVHEEVDAVQFSRAVRGGDTARERARGSGANQEPCLIRVRFRDRSTSAFGRVVLWQWDFGDGALPSREREPIHAYRAPGVYEVALECRDDYGYVDTVRRRIRVEARQPQRVNVFVDVVAEHNVLLPGEPLAFQMRFRCTTDEPLEATLNTTVVGAEGNIIERQSEVMMLYADRWVGREFRYALPRETGELRFQLEHRGVAIATHTVRVAQGRTLATPLRASGSGLEDTEGRRVFIRVSGDPAPTRRGSVLRRLQQGEVVRVLVVDDYLSAPGLAGTSPPSEETANTYYDILQGMLRTRFPQAKVEVTRLSRGHFTVYPPCERLALVPVTAEQTHANLIILASGIEDILNYMPEERYERFLWALVERLQGVTPAEIILVTPPPFVFNPALSGGYARAVKRVALRSGAAIADIYSAFALLGEQWQGLYREEGESDPVYYLSPRRRGQRIIAERLYEQIIGETP